MLFIQAVPVILDAETTCGNAPVALSLSPPALFAGLIGSAEGQIPRFLGYG